MHIKNLSWLVVSILVILLDQYTKMLAITHLSYATPLQVIPGFFNFTLLFNHGAAFSFLAGSSGWQRWFFSAIAVVMTIILLVWLLRVPSQKKWFLFAISLIIGGALGNLIDRVRLGCVIDFLDVYVKNYHWPAFNIADSGVVVGACILAIYFFKTEK